MLSNGGQLIVARGTYRFDQALYTENLHNVQIQGAGMWATKFLFTINGDA